MHAYTVLTKLARQSRGSLQLHHIAMKLRACSEQSFLGRRIVFDKRFFDPKTRSMIDRRGVAKNMDGNLSENAV